MTDNWTEIVKRYRVRHGLSQAEMAELMKVSQRTISRWERGEDSPGIQFKKRLRDLTIDPPEQFLRALTAAVINCPAPRALSRSQSLTLMAVSGPAIEKRPSIKNWIGRDLAPIATGLLEQILDDHDLQTAIISRDVLGIKTVATSVLSTPESRTIGKFRTTISYFFHEGTLYSDAIAVPADEHEPVGYWPVAADNASVIAP